MTKLTLQDKLKQTVQWVIDQQNHLDSRHTIKRPFYEQLHSFSSYVNAFKYFFYKKHYKMDPERRKYYHDLRKRLLALKRKTEEEDDIRSISSCPSSEDLIVNFDTESHHEDATFEQSSQCNIPPSLLEDSTDDSSSERVESRNKSNANSDAEVWSSSS